MDPVTIVPVVLAGGSGTRLWPLSRAGYPKQFLSLLGAESLFQQALARLVDLEAEDIHVGAPLIVGNEDHRFLILDQLRGCGLDSARVVLEPAARNTAPALTLAALQALDGGEDPVLVVAPADQTVTDRAAFKVALQRAARNAAELGMVLLGIKPDLPETGFGYLRASGDGQPVERFIEKPDQDTAQRLLAEGGYYWNGGLFVLKASSWTHALERFRPDIAQAVGRAWDRRNVDGRFIRPGATEFAAVPAESVDYAVMERCPESDVVLRMVELDAGWSDLGTWDATWQVSRKDAQGNVVIGDTIVSDSRNSLVHATHRLVSVVGVNDVVVVETPDAVLIADRTHSQGVKGIVSCLDRDERDELALPRKVHRPWGWYDSIDSGARFKVKRILVNPGASLSLQMHHHRAEHWVVVTGTAEVTCGDRKLLLTENQSTYIPLGGIHRLANPGKIPLEIIEVQSGSYLGEDDIVRLQDTYGRS